MTTPHRALQAATVLVAVLAGIASGAGQSPFPVQRHPFGDGVRGLLAADFDADGLPDVVGMLPGEVVLRFGTEDGGVGRPAFQHTDIYPMGQTPAELDDIGWVAVVTAHPGSGTERLNVFRPRERKARNMLSASTRTWPRALAIGAVTARQSLT